MMKSKISICLNWYFPPQLAEELSEFLTKRNMKRNPFLKQIVNKVISKEVSPKDFAFKPYKNEYGVYHFVFYYPSTLIEEFKKLGISLIDLNGLVQAVIRDKKLQEKLLC